MRTAAWWTAGAYQIPTQFGSVDGERELLWIAESCVLADWPKVEGRRLTILIRRRGGWLEQHHFCKCAADVDGDQVLVLLLGEPSQEFERGLTLQRRNHARRRRRAQRKECVEAQHGPAHVFSHLREHNSRAPEI